jgi:hypothetical protein
MSDRQDVAISAQEIFPAAGPCGGAEPRRGQGRLRRMEVLESKAKQTRSQRSSYPVHNRIRNHCRELMLRISRGGVI